MVTVDRLGPEVRRLVEVRTAEVVSALRAIEEPSLLAPSALPTWSRLTVACHLRYGAEALVRTTTDARAGRRTAYYPHGRSSQRPGTLVPRPGESPRRVVEGLAESSGRLGASWAGLERDDWATPVLEPVANADLGASSLGRLALGRLTELEVHGTDLAIGLRDWSPAFVAAALPFRLEWLNRRRANHRTVDETVQGSWRLTAHEGLSYLVSVTGDEVSSAPAPPGTAADAHVLGSARDLLALLLGRPTVGALRVDGDEALAWAFGAAFPGP